MEKEKRIELLVLVIIVGLTLAVCFHYIQGSYLEKPYPRNTFLFRPDDRFNDFFNPLIGSADLDPYRPDKIDYIGGYPPFGYLVAYLFSLIKPWIFSWALFIVIFFLCFYFLLRYFLFGKAKYLTPNQYLSLFAITFLTYPIIFAADRSNFDLIVCILIFFFVLFYQKQRILLSTIILGLAIAIKPFAGLFISIFLIDKKYKEAGLLTLSVIALTALSLSLFKGGFIIELQKFISNMINVKIVITQGSIARFSSDLYDLLMITLSFILRQFGTSYYLAVRPMIQNAYNIFAGSVLIAAFVFLWKKHLPFWKVLSILTILMILLPYSSGDYRLTYLFPALVLFLIKGEKGVLDAPLLIMWGLLMIPKNYYLINGDQNIGMIINPLLLISILVLTIRNVQQKEITKNEKLPVEKNLPQNIKLPGE